MLKNNYESPYPKRRARRENGTSQLSYQAKFHRSLLGQFTCTTTADTRALLQNNPTSSSTIHSPYVRTADTVPWGPGSLFPTPFPGVEMITTNYKLPDFLSGCGLQTPRILLAVCSELYLQPPCRTWLDMAGQAWEQRRPHRRRQVGKHGQPPPIAIMSSLIYPVRGSIPTVQTFSAGGREGCEQARNRTGGS